MTYNPVSPLIGTPEATQLQCVRWLISGPTGEYTIYDVTTVIVPIYWHIALSVGIDPVLALAQMGVETTETDAITGKRSPLCSFWSQRDIPNNLRSGGRNPAGIGVDGTHQDAKPTDTTGWKYNTQRRRWEKGLSFPDWDAAATAHIGRLVAYATLPHERTAAQMLLVSKALAVRPLPLAFHGTAPILKYLGKAQNPKGAEGAGWAGKDTTEGGTYGTHIAAVANQIQKKG